MMIHSTLRKFFVASPENGDAQGEFRFRKKCRSAQTAHATLAQTAEDQTTRLEARHRETAAQATAHESRAAGAEAELEGQRLLFFEPGVRANFILTSNLSNLCSNLFVLTGLDSKLDKP